MCQRAPMTRDDDFRVRPGRMRSKRETAVTWLEPKPNFALPDDTNFDFIDGGPTTRFTPLPLRRQRIGHRQRGWSSSLFAAQPQRFDSPSTMLPRATRVQKTCSGLARETHIHGLQHCKPMVFLPPDHRSGNFAGWRMFS